MRRLPIRATVLFATFTGLVLACQRPSENTAKPDSAATRTPPPPAPEERLAPIDSGAPRLKPLDQADTSFRAFRLRTLRALNQRDTAYLYGMLTRDIKNSFGGDDGVAGFKRVWKLDEPNSPVWDALSRVLRLGGKQINNDQFIAPYVHAFWPDSIDSFEYVAVTSQSARVYEKPGFESAILGTTSHAIVRLIDWRSVDEAGAGALNAWANVMMPNGTQGWLKADDVYSPVGWRAYFIMRSGRWRMQTFVAGD